MSIFSGQHKISEIVEHDSGLLPVLNRFGIILGFGDISVEQVCSNNHIDINFFLAILNVYHNDNYFPEQKFHQFKITDLITYLNKTHHYYRSYVIPEIERLLNILLINDIENKDILHLLELMFSSFKNEFNKHIDYEEKKIFPLINDITNKTISAKSPALKSTEFNFTSIHSKLDDKIIDIKNILIKYLPPINDINNCNAFAVAIFRFEKDIKDHARIEDRILYSRVKHFFNKSATDHDE